MAYTLLGKNFTPADVEPKITGRAKYVSHGWSVALTYSAAAQNR